GNVSRFSASAARAALVSFLTDVQHGRYAAARQMYTADAIRLGGGPQVCLRALEGLHDYAAAQQARGERDVLKGTIARARAAHWVLRRGIATTADLGRPGTTTRLIYRAAAWKLDTPA